LWLSYGDGHVKHLVLILQQKLVNGPTYEWI
jgi:hypothetical protein